MQKDYELDLLKKQESPATLKFPLIFFFFNCHFSCLYSSASIIDYLCCVHDNNLRQVLRGLDTGIILIPVAGMLTHRQQVTCLSLLILA